MREDVVNEDGELIEEAPFVYEARPSNEYIKKITIDKLEIYNEKNPAKKMKLEGVTTLCPIVYEEELKNALQKYDADRDDVMRDLMQI